MQFGMQSRLRTKNLYLVLDKILQKFLVHTLQIKSDVHAARCRGNPG